LRGADEPTCPFNEYGRQKALVEQCLMSVGNTAVLRLTKVIGPSVPLFDRWISSGQGGETIRPFADLTLAPVKLDRVATVAREIASLRRTGIHHLSGDQDISYFDAARIGFRAIGIDEALISPGQWSESGCTNAAPPRYSSLDVSETRAPLSRAIETSEQTIRDYFVARAGDPISSSIRPAANRSWPPG
jgi:dTDP-4-dehydrorhamnose reductase